MERRRLLQMMALGSLAIPVVALAGCASNPSTPRTRRWWQRGGGNNDAGDKGGTKR